MPTSVYSTDIPNETSFAPLGMLGYCLTRTAFLAPVWAELDLGMKTVDHSPQNKLQDIVTSILAGCRAVAQVNTRLCPDLALACAWGKKRAVLRLDAGFGSDANVNYALKAQWQVLTKNKGGRRPQAWAKKVAAKDWEPLENDRWVAQAVAPPAYVCPTRCLVLRWLTPSSLVKHAVVLCSIPIWTTAETIEHYDDRGACETEIQADKAGLKMARRRKKRLAAQEALVLLTDVAHNLLAWVPQWMFPEQPLAGFGTTRLTQDVFQLPGRLFFDHGRLTEVQLNRLHPHAEMVAAGLQRLLSHFGHP